jgi:hypothetical protein
MTEITVEKVRELKDKYSKATPTTNEEAKKLVHEMANAFPAMAALIIKQDADLKFERKFTGLKDRLGKPILEGNIVHWTDGGDDLSLAERIATRWDRIAKVILDKKQATFKVIDSPSQKTKDHGHTFEYGSFIYEDTERYLTIVAENEQDYNAKFRSAADCMRWVLQALNKEQI